MSNRAVSIDEIAVLLAQRPERPRTLVAVAGPPGAGKSMAAARLAEALDRLRPGSTAVVPMDGFHYDDGVLEALGLRARKGAPETFDVAGFAHLLGRLRRDEEPAIAVPLFDRGLEIARAGARLVTHEARVVIIEGNYLLLSRPPWSALAPFFQMTLMLRVSEAELRRRLTARWAGYALTPAAIADKLEGNDLPNARLVIEASGAANYEIPG